ncbi:MAG: hypothetical protein P8Z31_01895 [Gammaproteobacteria bacterium]|jgi:hypothetical protein
MNSDERLDRLLDGVRPPVLDDEFHARLFARTRPPQCNTAWRERIARSFGFTRLADGLAVAGVLAMTVALAILMAGHEHLYTEPHRVVDAAETEPLWFADFEEDDSQTSEEALLDAGIADLYAIAD